MAHVYVRSGAGGAATGADWANAYLTLSAAATAKAAGDQFWVSEDHSETTASAVTITSPGTAASPCTIRCVNHAGTVPPVSADLTSGALVVTTGASNLTFNGYADCDGIEFRAGTAGSSATMVFGSTTGFWRFRSLSKLTLINTNSGSTFTIGTASASVPFGAEFLGSIFKFGAVGQGFLLRDSRTLWREGSVDAAGSIPTNLISTCQNGAIFVAEAVDLSALSTGKTLVAAFAGNADVFIKDCKLDSAVTVAATPASPAGARVLVSRSASTGIAYVEQQYLYAGSEIATIGVVRTGGASASHKVSSTANAKFILPYLSTPLAIWSTSTAADVTVTVEGVANMAALPKNDEVWFAVEYLGASATSLGSVKSGAKADILATGAALTASTQAWDTGATARANTTAYVLGDVIKLASNSGRVFFCTTAGTTAGSEPGGYATAVDGDSVTDNTAAFRAGYRFKQALVLNSPQPQIAGLLYVYPRVGVASTTVYIDRAVVLS